MELFLLVLLPLFSGLFPRAEPAEVSDGEKGKPEPGRRGAQSAQTWHGGSGDAAGAGAARWMELKGLE